MSPLPSITKKSERENDAFKIKERNPRKKKKVKDRLIIIRKLNTTKVAWLKRYVPVSIKVLIQAITRRVKIPRYSNWAIAGTPSMEACASGNLKL